MVVLSRQCYETIMVGNDIEITVVHIGGHNVQLGITAPSEVDVHRKEPSEVIQCKSPAATVVRPDETSSRTEPRFWN